MRNLGFLDFLDGFVRAMKGNQRSGNGQQLHNKEQEKTNGNFMKKWNKLKLIEECQPNFQRNKPLADCFCIFWPLRVRPHPESSHERPIFSALGQDSPVSSGCPYA